MGKHSGVLSPHNSIWGLQICLASRTRTQTGTLLQHMVLGLSVCPAVCCYIQGRLFTGQPTATTFTAQQRLHTPATSLMSQHPKPIARITRVAQLASFKLLVGAFQFSGYLGLPETPALLVPALVKLYTVSAPKPPDCNETRYYNKLPLILH